jgi:hypothetical protein
VTLCVNVWRTCFRERAEYKFWCDDVRERVENMLKSIISIIVSLIAVKQAWI